MCEDYNSYGTETNRTVQAEESGSGHGIYIRSSMQSIYFVCHTNAVV